MHRLLTFILTLTRSVNNADLNELKACIFVEPSLHATATTLYLTTYCADISTGSIIQYLVHFRCSGACTVSDAASWEYIGRLLTPADAQAATGNTHYQAPALVTKNSKTYLLATPIDTSTPTARYNGCRVYEMTDINSNQLKRTNGNLVEIARIDGEANTHNGACAAYSGIDGGILYSQVGSMGTANAFQIYKSQVFLP